MLSSAEHGRWRVLMGVVGALLALLIWPALLGSGQAADPDVCVAGTDAGACSEPKGVAIDREAGLLYVAEAGNNRVSVFDADTEEFVAAFGWGVTNGAPALQTCTMTCLPGAPGLGDGQLNNPTGIAVDNDPTSPAFHDVYVFDGANRRVQRFHLSGGNYQFVLKFGSIGTGPGQFDRNDNPLALGPDGTIYVGGQDESEQTRVQAFEPTGALIDEIVPLTAELCGGSLCASVAACEAEGIEEALNKRVAGMAVDAVGDMYVATPGITGAVRKYDPAGNLLDPCEPINPSLNILAVAIDAAGNLFVADLIGGIRAIAEYDASGAKQRVIYGSAEYRTEALTIHSDGDIFAVDGKGSLRVVQITPEPPGPVVLPFGPGPVAAEISNTKATLKAQINPQGKASTYHFEYVDAETCEEDIANLGPEHCFDQAIRVPGEASEDPTIGGAGDFDLHPVQRAIGCPDPATEAGEPESKCLTPETEYRWQVIAQNADGEGNSPQEGTPFTTKSGAELGEVWATAVGTVDARLHGEVDPLGIPAVAWFEYVDDATFQESGFANATQVPSETEPIDLGGGEGFVAVAVNLTGLTPGTTYHYRLAADNQLVETLFSAAEVFTTFAPALTPPPCPNDSFRSGPSASLPDCRAYELVSPLDKAGGDIVPLFDIDFDQGAANGESITYTSYRAFGDATSAPLVVQYLARRSSGGWESESIAPTREGPSFYGGIPLLNNPFKLFSEDLCQGWVTTETEPILSPEAFAGYPGLYRRDNCDPGSGAYEAMTTTFPEDGDPDQFVPKVQGFSKDGTVTAFTAEGDLNPDVPGGVVCDKSEGDVCTRQLYVSTGGGGAPQPVCFLPNGTPLSNSCSAGFLRVSGGKINERSDDTYQAISEEGSRVFWTAASLGSGPLYLRTNPTEEQSATAGEECLEIEKACTYEVSAGSAHFRSAAANGSRAIYTEANNLFEFTTAKALGEETASTKLAGLVPNVLGTSKDASRTYFVSREVLTAAEENSEGDKAAAGKANLYLHEAGAGFTFVATLAEGDKSADTDQPPRTRDSRVSPDGSHLAFVSQARLTGYDNTDAGSGKADKEVFLYDADAAQLRCVSCNPSGARPVGLDLNEKGQIENWVAGRIPGWSTGPRFSQILSPDGSHLFFEAAAPLVLGDTNGTVDVYEWELASGPAQCKAAGAALYSAEAEGCISLISSGQSPEDSQLIDASSDAQDVFFKTQSSLVAGDPGLIDIYNARVGGGFPSPPPPIPPCEGEACQSPPPPPVEITPGTTVIESQGNLTEAATPKPRGCPKGKRKVRKGGKARCVKKQKKAQGKRARQGRRAGR